MKADALQIGLIGAGANTRLRHIPGFQAIPGVKLAVVANRTPESGAVVAKAHGIPRVAAHWREVVEDPTIDAICIGTWPNLHAEITCAALANGKHVLTEARMAMNLAHARAMFDASCTHAGLVAQIVPAPFSLPFDKAVRRLLEAGTLGRILQVQVTHRHSALADPEAPITWRQRADLSGHNMLTLGIYHEIVHRWFRQSTSWVMADGWIATPRRIDPDSGQLRAVDLPDTLSVSGRFADGSQLWYQFSGLEHGRGRNEIRVVGESGTLVLDLIEGGVFLSQAGSTADRPWPVPGDQQEGWRVEGDFIDSIRLGSPVRRTCFADGLQYMAFTEAVHQSWVNNGRRTPVPSVES